MNPEARRIIRNMRRRGLTFVCIEQLRDGTWGAHADDDDTYAYGYYGYGRTFMTALRRLDAATRGK